MISVRGPRITGKLCLMTCMLTFSWPSDLFNGIEVIMFFISDRESEVKLNVSPSSGLLLSERFTSE